MEIHFQNHLWVYVYQRFFYGALPKGTGTGEIDFFTKIPYRDFLQNPYRDDFEWKIPIGILQNSYRDDFEFEQKNLYGDFPSVL